MGYPLHGHELSAEISPVMARAGWAVGWDKSTFTGKDALVRQREEKSVPLVRGIVSAGRGIPRPGMVVRSVGPDGGPGDVVGEVTSGTFSPTLRQGIGLALLDRAVGDGDDVLVEVRRRAEPFTVTKPPFVAPST
jgi:aminomethyltransferase